MRHLIFMRHGKAAGESPANDDFARPLVARGEHDVLNTAQIIAGFVNSLDLALMSPAKRTADSWRRIAHILPANTVLSPPQLYLAEPEQIWALVEQYAPLHSSLLVVGHNPGLHQLASRIARDNGSENAHHAQKLRDNMPTASAAIFGSIDRDWDPHSLKLRFFTGAV